MFGLESVFDTLNPLIRKMLMRSLIKHVRDENRNPVATVVVINDNGQLKGGVAVCNEKDNFHKKYGVEIAMGRALKNRGLSGHEDIRRDINWHGQEMPLGLVITNEYIRLCERLSRSIG